MMTYLRIAPPSHTSACRAGPGSPIHRLALPMPGADIPGQADIPRSGVVTQDRLGDAGGLLAALHLDGAVDHPLHGVDPGVLDRAELGREPDLGADRDGCREP